VRQIVKFLDISSVLELDKVLLVVDDANQVKKDDTARRLRRNIHSGSAAFEQEIRPQQIELSVNVGEFALDENRTPLGAQR